MVANAFPQNPTAWRIQDRNTSGVYIYSLDGSMLARLGSKDNPSVFLYDKRMRREIEISVASLIEACNIR